MSGLKLTTPEQHAEMQKLLREQVKAPRTELKNVGLAANLEAGALLQFRRRNYSVRPVSYRLGIQLQEIYLEIRRIADEEQHAIDADDAATLIQLQRTFGDLMDRGKDLFRACVKPVSPLRRVMWPLLSNPFDGCTNQEFSELLDFFLRCRTRSSVALVVNSATRPSLSSRALPTTLPYSSIGSHDG